MSYLPPLPADPYERAAVITMLVVSCMLFALPFLLVLSGDYVWRMPW